MSTSWLTQGKDAIDAWEDYFNGKGVTPYGAFYKSLRAFSSFTGVPVTGVMREGVDLWNNTAGAIDEEQKILKWERKVEDRVKLIMDAYEDGDTASAKERYSNLLKDLASDKDMEEARSSIKSSIGTLYKDGVYSKALTSRILEKYIGLDENEIYWTFDRWDNTTDGYAKFDNLWDAVEDGENLKGVIEEYTEHGVEVKTLRSSITSHFKPLYLALEGKEKANMKKMLLDAYQALGVDRADASKNIDRWKESEE
jgi:Ca2+-binding EF-hand superfamily protein